MTKLWRISTSAISILCSQAMPICSLKWCYMFNRISEWRHLIAQAGLEKKKKTLRHMHGYHETLINCGASLPGSRLLCILRAGPRKTTCLSAPANFKMIYRPRKSKFFAVLRGFSAASKSTADAFDMQLWPVWARSVKLTSLIDCYFISSPSSRTDFEICFFQIFRCEVFGWHVSR